MNTTTATYIGPPIGDARTYLDGDRRVCRKDIMPGERVTVIHEGTEEKHRRTLIRLTGWHGYGWFIKIPNAHNLLTDIDHQ